MPSAAVMTSGSDASHGVIGVNGCQTKDLSRARRGSVVGRIGPECRGWNAKRETICPPACRASFGGDPDTGNRRWERPLGAAVWEESAADPVAGGWDLLNGQGPVGKVGRGTVTFGPKTSGACPVTFDCPTGGGPSWT